MRAVGTIAGRKSGCLIQFRSSVPLVDVHVEKALEPEPKGCSPCTATMLKTVSLMSQHYK